MENRDPRRSVMLNMFAVTCSGSLYRILIDGTRAERPHVELLIRGRNNTDRDAFPGSSQFFVGLTKENGIVLFHPYEVHDGFNLDSEAIKLRGGRTTPLVALFEDYDEAISCCCEIHSAGEIESFDERW